MTICTAMPLLRAKELKHVISKAKVTHALCDLRLAEELKLAAAEAPDKASAKAE